MLLPECEPLFEECRQLLREGVELAAAKLSFKRKAEVLSNPTGSRSNGDVVVRRIEELLDSFKGYERTPEQRAFHTAMVNAALPHLYGKEDWSRHQVRILGDRGVSQFQPEVMICCPRRMGKTTSVSMFIAVVLYVAPKAWISCFSPGQRASTTLLQQAAEFLVALPGGRRRILKQNNEELVVRGQEDGDKRIFKSFPSSIVGLRGQGGNILILEEASQLKPALFNQVIVPLLGVNNTAVIAISTPLAADNYFSKLLVAVKPNGAPLFCVITIARVCPACLARRLLSCPHSTTQPPWKSDEREELVKTLLIEDPEVFMREQLGIVTCRDTPAFDHAAVDRAWATRRPLETLDVRDGMLYMTIDPAGGGKSGFAVLTCFQDANTNATVVASADAERVETEAELRTYLSRHVRALRAVHKFSACRIVLIIENNFGGAVLASVLAAMFSDFQPLSVLSGDTTKHHRAGVTTTAIVKEHARVHLNCQLKLGLLHLLDRSDFVSLDENACEKLHRELLAFRFCEETKGGRTRTVLSGKSLGGNDDLCIALLLCLFWKNYAIANGQGCFLQQ